MDIEFAANNGTGSYSVYKPSSASLTRLAGITVTGSINTSAVEAQLKPGLEYDYASGKFYYTNAALVDTKKELAYKWDPTTPGTTTFMPKGGLYVLLENVATPSANVVKVVEGAAVGYEVTQTDDGYMPIVEGTGIDTANNLNMGFILIGDEVLEETATVKGINSKLWEKDSNGQYHKVVDEKTVYTKKDANPDGTHWNYTKTSGGDIEWAYENWFRGVEDVFHSVNGNTSEQCLVITESPYLRIRSAETAAVTSDLYNSAYKVADSAYANSISEAGKVKQQTNTYVTVESDYNKRRAMFADVKADGKGIREKKVGDFNVGKVINEFYTVEPAAGYYLQADGAGDVRAYRYTFDYHYACNPNWKEYTVLNGRYVEIKAYNFGDEEVANASYCKDGYTKFNGKFYSVIAEKESSNDKWLPTNYHYAWYKDAAWMYDETKTFELSQASNELKDVPVDKSKCVEVTLGKDGLNGDKWDGWYLVETDLSKIFVNYGVQNKTFVQSSVNGRFYEYTGK